MTGLWWRCWLGLALVGQPGPDGVLRIEPVRPVQELRRRALAQSPPPEPGRFRQHELVEIRALDPGIVYDIRYAGPRNFLGVAVYESAHAFLQRPAAEALVKAHRDLGRDGYGLLVHDAYRPWWVTKVFWEATPIHLREFVADPAKGSRHNRGCAVDLTLYDLHTGQPVEMPSLYDEMSPRAYPDYQGGTALPRQRRDRLRRAMEAVGFSVFKSEWWHFDYKDWRQYRIGNESFEQILQRQGRQARPASTSQ